METLIESAAKKIPDLASAPDEPSRFGRLCLRLMVFEPARTTSVENAGARDGSCWSRLRAVLLFIRAGARTPALRTGLGSVKLSDIEKSFGPFSPQMEAVLTRYFRVKIQSLHFCGAAFNNRSLMTGFRSLALLYPVILWLSRWLAVSDGRTNLADTDVAHSISMVDYHHGYSPDLEWRVRLLHQRNNISKLCGYYGH